MTTLPETTLARLRSRAEGGHDDARVLLHLIARVDKRDQDVAKFVDSYSSTIAALCRRLEALERGANYPPAAPVDDSPVSNALLQAEAALADVAEGEAVSPHAVGCLHWAEARCTQALAAIRPVMKEHGIRTSEWPAAAPAPAPGENLATPPSPEAPGEALAARPLLEQVARLDDSVGITVAEVRQLAGQAAAWLRSNPPGQPVAIEPRGCPTPGACSCVGPTPPAPEPGEVGEVVAYLRRHSSHPEARRAATLLQQQEAELAALRGAAVAVSERLRIVKAGIRAGYNLGHHHTVEGGWGDPDEVADDIAQETLDDIGLPPAPQCLIARMANELDRLQPLPAFPPDTSHPLATEARALLQGTPTIPLPAPQAGEVEA